MEKRHDIRNIAIIAHVDHGKTTLVDCLLKQTGVFRANEQVVERVLDSNELERERGITILAKNTAITYQGTRINVIDTPGHADFGGEVERTLRLADGALLLVDAFEGPMPQTKFVLRKALEAGLKVIVVINKIDRPNARPHQVVDEVFDLFIELEANDEQLDFPVVYTSARLGYATLDPEVPTPDMRPLLDLILREVPEPTGDPQGALQIHVTTLDYDDYVGRTGIGRVVQGTIEAGEPVVVCKRDGSVEEVRAGKLYLFEGLKRVEAPKATIGDIVAMIGLGHINIGETVCSPEAPLPLPLLEIEQPTLTMNFLVNDSPFAGREGKYLTSRHLRDRLFREAETNVALRVEETGSPDVFRVCGRGELHLAILLETMRREGYELQVSKPEPILKEVDGQKQEPYEHLVVYVPENYVGPVIERVGQRRGEALGMHSVPGGQVKLEFYIPARGLIGFRSEFLTETKGYGVMYHVFHHYGPYRGEIRGRQRGVLVASETGTTTAYALHALEERGELFVGPGVEVYAGQVVGECARDVDIDVNVCKKKRLTNMRASTADEAVRLTPPRQMDLDRSLEFINEDELVEITPTSVRIRKKELDPKKRWRAYASAS